MPENHDCSLAPPRTPLGSYESKKTLAKASENRGEFISEGEFHFERKKEQPIFERTKKKRRFGKWQFAALAILTAIIISNILFWNFAYERAIQDSYSLGFQVGSEEERIAVYAEGHTDGEETGYVKGLKDGAGTGYNIRDPSYQEMLDFIASDRTDQKTYSENYTCVNFAKDFLNHAFDSGYKAGLVYITFSDGAHIMVCFDTVDRGMVFVETQSDEIVRLQVGRAYTFVEPPNVVESFTVIW